MAEGKVAADPVGKCIFYFHNFYIFLISFSFSKSRKFPKFVVLTIYTSKVVLNILFLNFVEKCWVLFLFFRWQYYGLCDENFITKLVWKKMDQYYLQLFVHFLYLTWQWTLPLYHILKICLRGNDFVEGKCMAKDVFATREYQTAYPFYILYTVLAWLVHLFWYLPTFHGIRFF